ncbi:TPA: tape measure protein [Serratia odorifera]
MVIRELLIKLGLNGGAQVNRELDRVDSGVNKTMQSFNALGGVIAGVFGALTISNIAKTADTMQSLESRIGLLPQTVGDVGAAFDEVAKKATENRMGIQAYAEVYTRIGNAAQDYLKTSADLEKVTSTLSQALVVGGATAQEQASAFLQFSQALGSGTLQGDEFRAMAEAAPQYLDQLAKALGHPRGELKKLASEGKLTTKEVIQATMQMSDYFNKMYKQIPMTIGQALVLVNNRWSMFINRLNRSSGAVTWVADKFLWLADKVEHSLDIVIDALGGAENAVKLLGIALGAAGLVAGVWALTAAFSLMASPVALIVAGLTLLYLVFDDISGWYQGNKSIFGDIFGPIGEHVDDVRQMKTAMSDLLEVVKALWRGIVALKDALNDLPGADAIKTIGDTLGTTKIGPWLKATASNYWEGAKGTVKDVNRATYGVFDIPQMWSDAMRGLATSNQSSSMASLSPPQRSMPSSMQYGLTRPDVNVTIGNITVPAGTTEQQQAFLRDSAQKTFNEVGWSKMADNMNFNTGG